MDSQGDETFWYKEYCHEIDQGNISERILKEFQTTNGTINTKGPVAHSVCAPESDGESPTLDSSVFKNEENSKSASKEVKKNASGLTGNGSKLQSESEAKTWNSFRTPSIPRDKTGSTTTAQPSKRARKTKRKSVLAKMLSFEDELEDGSEDTDEDGDVNKMDTDEVFTRPPLCIPEVSQAEETSTSRSAIIGEKLSNALVSVSSDEKHQQNNLEEESGKEKQFIHFSGTSDENQYMSNLESRNNVVSTSSSGYADSDEELWEKCLISALSLIQDYGVSVNEHGEEFIEAMSTNILNTKENITDRRAEVLECSSSPSSGCSSTSTNLSPIPEDFVL